MKRLCFFIAVTCLSAVRAMAWDKYFMVDNDIYPCAVPASEVSAVGYVNADKTLTMKYKDGRCVWTTDIIKSIEVTEFPCETLFSDDADVSQLARDKQSELVRITETVPTDKDDPDYEEFIENYNRACKVTVNFNGNRATVTVVPSDYDVEYTVSRSNVILKIKDKKVQVIAQGTSDNGSLKIYSDYKFRLDLNSLNLTNAEGPAVNIQSKKRAYVNLLENSENVLGSGAEFKTQYSPNGFEEDAKATFFSEGQLIFSGPGSLLISSLANHGICSDDYIRFRSTLGTVSIKSAGDGIHTNDFFRMYGGGLLIESGDNAIQVEDGDVSFFNGSVVAQSKSHGIVAESDMLPIGMVNVYGMSKLAVVSVGRSAISCDDGYFADGGYVLLQSQGPGSRCIKSDSKIVLKNGFLKTSLNGCVPVWNADSQDYTQPAALRAHDSIFMENVSYCALIQDVMGAKIVNSDSAVVISNSVVSIDSQQDDYNAGEYECKVKAIEGNDILIGDKSFVYIKSNKRMISAERDFEVSNSVLKLMSDFSDSDLLKCKNRIIRSSALFYNKLTVE